MTVHPVPAGIPQRSDDNIYSTRERTPHTRGYTPHPPSTGTGQAGNPVCAGVWRYTAQPESEGERTPVYAGVFPPDAVALSDTDRSPRTPGVFPVQFTDRHLLSPCARGYSLSGQKRSVSSVVVPVYAGVFRAWTASPGSCSSCPRVHGGIPPVVKPASPGLVRGCPHVRGGIPGLTLARQAEALLSPCKRGYSLRWPGLTAKVGVVPMYAGVFPTPRVGRLRGGCCPRVRGSIPFRIGVLP